MRFIGIGFLFVALLGLSKVSFCQNINAYRNIISNGNIKKEYSEAKNNKNELESTFSGLFLAYKTFFSSQDLTVCTFTPSCSEYGILAVKKYGIIKGGVLTMDRLTRCNGLSPNNYEIDKATMLLKDDPREAYSPQIVSKIK